MFKALLFLFFAKAKFCSCLPEKRQSGFAIERRHFKKTKAFRLPAVLNENSGLAYDAKQNLFWGHNDSGGRPMLFAFDESGQLRDSLKLNSPNVDWEEMALLPNGEFVVADLGNNQNKRKDLALLKVNGATEIRTAVVYAQQAKTQCMNYDAEAMLVQGNTAFVFSKNREKKDRSVRLYAAGLNGQAQSLMAFDSIYVKTQVTAAAMNPSQTEFVLLTYGKLLFFEMKDKRVNFEHPKFCMKFAKQQTEALTYVNDQDLLVTNEQGQAFWLKRKRHLKP